MHLTFKRVGDPVLDFDAEYHYDVYSDGKLVGEITPNITPNARNGVGWFVDINGEKKEDPYDFVYFNTLRDAKKYFENKLKEVK